MGPRILYTCDKGVVRSREEGLAVRLKVMTQIPKSLQRVVREARVPHTVRKGDSAHEVFVGQGVLAKVVRHQSKGVPE
jgi:hypothetical protein